MICICCYAFGGFTKCVNVTEVVIECIADIRILLLKMRMFLICLCLASLLSESLAFLNLQYNSAMNQYLNDINKFKTGQYSLPGGQVTNNGFSYATNEYGKYFVFPVNTMEVTDRNIFTILICSSVYIHIHILRFHTTTTPKTTYKI